MEKERPPCKHCAEYGSAFCDACLQEQEKNKKPLPPDTK